ncbi:hypothetical protein HDU82_003257 [Entophlyctis luteolus]|nr:hypothetical protein HDU82_003257 [Entophlyctis luteolus]
MSMADSNYRAIADDSMMLFAFDETPVSSDADSALLRVRNNSVSSAVSAASSASLCVSLQSVASAATAPTTSVATAASMATAAASARTTGPVTAVTAAVPASSVSPRTCSFCHTITTPMWRHGPVGYDPLCNSCGVKWKRGRILHGLERAPKLPSTLNLNQQLTATPSRKNSKASLLVSSPSAAILQTPPLSASPDSTTTQPVPVRRRTASLPFNNSLPYSTSGRLRTHTAPARLLSASADARSIDAERRGSFVCQALEHVQSDASLRVVAEAVRVIQGRKMSVDGHLKAAAAAAAAAAAVCVEAGYMEIDLDVKDLSFPDWEYLWGVLGSVSL